VISFGLYSFEACSTCRLAAAGRRARDGTSANRRPEHFAAVTALVGRYELMHHREPQLRDGTFTGRDDGAGHW
jgi:hypothetical protein